MLTDFINQVTREFLKDKIDDLNEMINSLFPEHQCERQRLLQTSFIFLMIYSEFFNRELKSETDKIFEYIINYNNIKYNINREIKDTVYVLISSLIDADQKSKNSDFLKKFDLLLTRNIERLQMREDINYNPLETPVIKELLPILVPLFDMIQIRKHVNNSMALKII